VEEGAAERTCYGLTMTAYSPSPLHQSRGGRGKKKRSEVEPGKRGNRGRWWFNYFFPLTIQIQLNWQ